MGKLTTHVLDTASGLPAANLTVQLWRFGDDGSRIHVMTMKTDPDGRSAMPLVEDTTMTMGEYELIFCVREYFIEKEVQSPFLNHVPVRFTIFDTNQNYHVPLLVSPWSYSTYRGS